MLLSFQRSHYALRYPQGQHVLDFHKKEKCEHCEFYASKENMGKHVFLKHPTIEICDDCGVFFMDQVTLDKHISSLFINSNIVQIFSKSGKKLKI